MTDDSMDRYLARRGRASPSAAAGALPGDAAPLSPNTPVVFVVDDEHADDIASVLEGFDVTAATNLHDALAFLDSAERIDIAVIDMMIHDESAQTGRLILRQMNESDHRRRTPKIVVSASPRIGSREGSDRRFRAEHDVFSIVPKDGVGWPVHVLGEVLDALKEPSIGRVLAHLDHLTDQKLRRLRSSRDLDDEDRADVLSTAALDAKRELRLLADQGVPVSALWAVVDAFESRFLG